MFYRPLTVPIHLDAKRDMRLFLDIKKKATEFQLHAEIWGLTVGNLSVVLS